MKHIDLSKLDKQQGINNLDKLRHGRAKELDPLLVVSAFEQIVEAVNMLLTDVDEIKSKIDALTTKKQARTHGKRG